MRKSGSVSKRGRRPEGIVGARALLDEVAECQQDYVVADRQRRELILKAHENGCSYAELAEATGMSDGTVSVIIRKERTGVGAMH